MTARPRTLAVVPARGGSKRVPNKNLAVLGGRTLVRRTLDCALAAQRIDAVVLSSDAQEILDEARGLDVLARRRPAELATDTARSYDAAVDALGFAEEDAGLGPFEVLALLQCTTPFALPADLDAALSLLEDPAADSVVTVTRADDLAHPLKLKLLEGGRLRPFLADDELRPSHELPELWVRNGALYASRRHVLEAGSLLVAEPLAHAMPAERSVDINTPLDLAFAEFLLARSDPSETAHA